MSESPKRGGATLELPVVCRLSTRVRDPSESGDPPSFVTFGHGHSLKQERTV